MKKLALSTAVLFIILSGLWAFQFSPIEAFIRPSGSDSVRSYTIVNDSEDPIAISLSVVRRDQDETGQEIRTECNDFQILPSKIIVQPNSSYVVRVRYMGPQNITAERPYRLIAEQIPYSQGKNQEGGAMFNFLFIYATSLYVLPAESKVQVDVSAVKEGVSEDGERVLEVTVRNKGNIHQILLDTHLTLKDSKGQTITLEGEQIPNLDGFNLLARKTVTRTVPWPEGWEPEGKITGIIRYQSPQQQ